MLSFVDTDGERWQLGFREEAPMGDNELEPETSGPCNLPRWFSLSSSIKYSLKPA